MKRPATLDLYRLTQNSYSSPRLVFDKNISGSVFLWKIYFSDGRILKKEIQGLHVDDFTVVFPEFPINKNGYRYEMLRVYSGKNKLFLSGNYNVTDDPKQYGNDNSVVTITLDEGDTVINISIDEVNLNIGGDNIDLSTYAKRNSSNITEVLSWQSALDIFTATAAQAKNASQDTAINENAANIVTLNSGLQNEVSARQNADLDLAQTITALNGVMTTFQNWKEQMTEPDTDSVVNTLSEVLAVFQNVPEGANIIDLFNQKLSVSSVVNNLTSILTDVPVSAYQAKVLNDLIAALTGVVANKVDKDGLKVLSDQNFTLDEKNKIDALFLPVVKRVTTALVNSSATRVIVSDLTMNVEANKTYRIEFYGGYSTGVTTTGCSIQCTTSGGAVGTFIGSARGAISTANGATEISCQLGSVLTTTGVSAINTRHYLQMEGIFICSTSGNIVIQWGSEVEGSAATLSMGFFIITEL